MEIKFSQAIQDALDTMTFEEQQMLISAAVWSQLDSEGYSDLPKMEISFPKDVQKALDTFDESDRAEYIKNVVRQQLVRDGRIVTVTVGEAPDGDRVPVAIGHGAGGGGSPSNFNHAPNIIVSNELDRGGGLGYPYDYSPSPIAEKIDMTGIIPADDQEVNGSVYAFYLKPGIVSIATQQESDHFYDRSNEPARSIYPSHLKPKD